MLQSSICPSKYCPFLRLFYPTETTFGSILLLFIYPGNERFSSKMVSIQEMLKTIQKLSLLDYSSFLNQPCGYINVPALHSHTAPWTTIPLGIVAHDCINVCTRWIYAPSDKSNTIQYSPASPYMLHPYKTIRSPMEH